MSLRVNSFRVLGRFCRASGFVGTVGWDVCRGEIAAFQSGQYDDSMNLGFSEMVFIFFLALIIFGPKKLPEIGRQIGKALNEFKRASNEFKAQIESEINNLEFESKPEILPPSRPPQGAVASGALSELPPPPREPTPTGKAPDA